MAFPESRAPKKKQRLSLNGDVYGSFDVPFEYFSLSKMSGVEKKDLKRRLNWELEQVRETQNKVDNMDSHIVGLSPSSDVRSCSAGQKRPKLESRHTKLETSAPHGKKRPLPGRNGPKTKGSMSGHFEYVKPAAPVTSYAKLMKSCETLLNHLMSHKFGWVFKTPVDVVKLNIPDYFTVIKHPMDLGTVKSRITYGEYSNPMDFAADVRLTFSNAITYNPPCNDVHIMAETLSKVFEKRWKTIEKKIPAVDGGPSQPLRPVACVETEISDRIPPAKKKKISSNDTIVKPEPVKGIITDEEKQKLSLELEAMLGELPETIVDFLKEHSYDTGQTNGDEIEIDIDALSDDTLFKLRKLLDEYMLQKQDFQAKAGQCEIEMEILNTSRFSNSSLQPCNGNEQVEEDVDIVGGNDPPISNSNYPPVEIEIDGTNRNNKCSSSSCSGSESGTSSSDSDSGSSSGIGLDTAKASETLSATKEKVGSGLTSDLNRGEPGNSETRKDSMNMGNQVEQISQTKPVTIEPESCQEGDGLMPNNSDVIRAISSIRRNYETKLEQSEKRKQDSLARIVFEEQRGRELSMIVNELIPTTKNNSTQKPLRARKKSNDKRRMPLRLTEEAEKYIEDFISNVKSNEDFLIER